MASFLDVILAFVLVMTVFSVIFAVVVIMIFVAMILDHVFMIVMLIFAFQFGARIDNDTFRGIRNYEKVERLCQNQKRSINQCDVSVTFSAVFKPNDIRTGGVQFHCNLRSVDCDIKLANAVFVAVQLPRFLGKCRRRSKCCKREER